jgi:hypothetical protein
MNTVSDFTVGDIVTNELYFNGLGVVRGFSQSLFCTVLMPNGIEVVLLPEFLTLVKRSKLTRLLFQ